MRYTETSITPNGAHAVVAGEGSLLAITNITSDGSVAGYWSGSLPDNFKGWNAEGIRIRHKLESITTGSAQIVLTIEAPGSTVSTTTRTGLSSADGSWSYITAAGSGLSALGSGDFFTISLSATFSGGTDSAALLIGRIEVSHA